MKDKMDFFIKYYDGQLSESEKDSFEKKLISDLEFKEEYEKFLYKFNKLKETPELNETYFNNIIPKSLSEFRVYNGNSALKLAYFLPVIIIFAYFLFFGKNSESFKLNYETEELTSLYAENNELNETLLADAFNYHNSYVYDNIQINNIIEDKTIMDESLFDYLKMSIDEFDIDETLLNNLNDSEFDAVFSKMENKKIIGEK